MSRLNVKVLYSEEVLARRIAEMAGEIATWQTDRLLVVAILKGSFVFAADLLRAMHGVGMAPEVEFMSLSSYNQGTVSSGTVRVVHDIDSEVKGRDILLVDDILESGRTLAYAKDLLMARGAKCVKLCTLLEKPGKRAVTINAEFRGFECPDLFVIGYGMDVAHAYRQLPYVGYVET